MIRLFLDTTSKFRFYRKFKKTMRYLTNLKHDPHTQYMVIENTKQHNVAGWTNPNQIAYTHGVSTDQCATNTNLKRIDTYAKRLGYITGYSQDVCQFNDYYDPKMRPDSCVDHESPDHIFLGPSCSMYNGGVGIAEPKDKLNLFAETWGSASRKCFLGEDISKVTLEYLKDWIRVYKGKRKYFTFRTCMMHNMYSELVHDFDTQIEEFLRNVVGIDGNKEPNMIVRIYADPGDH